MNLVTAIAATPGIILSFIVISEARSSITLPTFWSISIYSTFFFYVIFLLIRGIFFGRFKWSSLEIEGEDYAGVIRALIGMLFLFPFFGLAFLEGAKELAGAAQITLIVPVIVGVVFALLIIIFEYSVFTYFKVEKVDNGIAFHDIKKYMRWYHYIALLLSFLFFYASFFTP